MLRPLRGARAALTEPPRPLPSHESHEAGALNERNFGSVYCSPHAIALEGHFIELLRTDALPPQPTVEMPDEPELDSAVDARKAVGCQVIGKQIDVPCQWALP
jgi:hypothetical protein